MRDALQDYVSILEANLSTLRSAADICKSTMGEEMNTERYIRSLNEGINELYSVAEQAESVSDRLRGLLMLVVGVPDIFEEGTDNVK